MSKLRETLEKIREFIDDEDSQAENALEKIEKSVKTSSSEKFRDKIVDEIDLVLRDEIIRFPSGKVYIPSNFTVLISSDEDKDLREDKRRFLEVAIGELILERAKDLAETQHLLVRTIGIEIKVDGTLRDGEIEVNPVSDSIKETMRSSDVVNLADLEKTFLETSEVEVPKTLTNNLEDTIDEENVNYGVLYYLDEYSETKKIAEHPIIKTEITIGRKILESVANVQISSDNRKISRIHASLRIDDEGEIWVTSMHNNPTFINGNVLTKGETIKLEENGKIEVYEHSFRVRFKD